MGKGAFPGTDPLYTGMLGMHGTKTANYGVDVYKRQEQHQILTGCTGKNILELAQYLSEIHKPVWIRHVLVPGGSDKDEYLDVYKRQGKERAGIFS